MNSTLVLILLFLGFGVYGALAGAPDRRSSPPRDPASPPSPRAVRPRAPTRGVSAKPPS